MDDRAPRRGRAPDLSRAEVAVRELLDALGIDSADPTFATTPRTVSRAFAEVLLAGYRVDPVEALGRGFPVHPTSRGPVVATHIPLMFMCPHHLMPARGEAHVAFLPRDRVPGLARIARLTDALAHRLILQEELTSGIVRALREAFDVRAAVAIIEASHTCVAIEDFARRDTVFRTRASIGPSAATKSLESEIDASLRSPWPTPASPPPSDPRASSSPSRSRASSAKTRSARTSSPRRPRSR